MVRVGIIGLGFMGRTHYESYQKIAGAKVVMVADKDPKRAAGDLSGGWGNLSTGAITQLPMDTIRGTTDFRALITDPEVDFVDICVPTPGHVDLAMQALEAGKHVMCEKPLAASSADASRIATAAASARGFFMPAMCVRFWPEWVWLKNAIADSRYGAVRSAVFRRLASMPAGWFKEGKISGGAVIDLHVHDADFIYHCFGKPTGVYSRGYTKTSGEIDHLSTQYLYDNIPLVSAEGGWCMADGFPFSTKYQVNFERATVDFDSSRPAPALQLYVDGKLQPPVELEPNDGFINELSYFVNCISINARPTRVTAADAVTGLQIIEAEKRSIASGRIEAI